MVRGHSQGVKISLPLQTLVLISQRDMRLLKLTSVFALSLIPSGFPTSLGGFKVFYEAATQFFPLSGPQLQALGQLLTERIWFLLLTADSSTTSFEYLLNCYH